ncbi:hypothetical protein NDU88_002732 [Pleurodeles waltl]|uniref:Uncharacterized protein n=1 Tax=Pleurodeles waltl TaxID=8319 RepID=A0AAV7VFT9_PLEWA|nr:hypothetical protein NDU88_002732 [Pleurodeles waltl]
MEGNLEGLTLPVAPGFMGQDKMTKPHASNTVTKYTTPRHPTQKITSQLGTTDTEDPLEESTEPSRVELLEAIWGLGKALEEQIDTVVIDVNLLRADLGKVLDKVQTAEINIADLQREVKVLLKQMAQMTTKTAELTRWAKDASAEIISECLVYRRMRKAYLQNNFRKTG